jgi:hypothetical protein
MLFAPLNEHGLGRPCAPHRDAGTYNARVESEEARMTKSKLLTTLIAVGSIVLTSTVTLLRPPGGV